jgi:hypothetical protein
VIGTEVTLTEINATGNTHNMTLPYNIFSNPKSHNVTLIKLLYKQKDIFPTGGNGVKIRRVSENIFNKQLRTADKEWCSSLVVRRELTTPYRERSACYGKSHRAPDVNGFFAACSTHVK